MRIGPAGSAALLTLVEPAADDEDEDGPGPSTLLGVIKASSGISVNGRSPMRWSSC